MAYYCYMVECVDGTYYTGWSKDPQRRMKVHNQGRGARYTRTRRPVKLVYVEEVVDHASALRRELEIKTYSRERKSRLVQAWSGKQTLTE
jgi:putative endonuclease